MSKLFGMSRKKADAQRRLRESLQFQEERQHLLTQTRDFFVREAYKTLRTNVFFSMSDDKESKAIMVTSSLQSEGKSVTAANLAISYAQAHRKVILVDCDLRRPKMARLMQAAGTVGLQELLQDTSLEELAITPSGVPNLDLLPAGHSSPNPSEMLGSSQMQRLLKNLRSRYDIIILDTPPVNMVVDAAVLAPMTDGVLFVVRANESERGAVMQAVNQLEYAKARILGFVLNGVDYAQSSYGYSRWQYKKYGYGARGRNPYAESSEEASAADRGKTHNG